MYTIRPMVDDWTSVSNFLADVWQFIGGILRLDPAAFQAAYLHDQDAILTLTILLLAGVSYTLGQSVVLFANRVPRRRFIFSLVMSALGLVVGVFFGRSQSGCLMIFCLVWNGRFPKSSSLLD